MLFRGLSQEDKSFMSEMVNEQSEGLEFIIDYLVGQNVTEITKLSTNPTVQLNYYKGHIPQINESGASLIVAEDVDRASLELQGYTRVGDYFGSNLDPNRVIRVITLLMYLLKVLCLKVLFKTFNVLF
jgi:hypothetical protein